MARARSAARSLLCTPAMERGQGSLGPLVVVIAALLACAPHTTYRHSAAVPAARPLAWDGRTVKKDSVRAEGAITVTSIAFDAAPQVHDTALHVPSKTLDGSLTYAFTNR